MPGSATADAARKGVVPSRSLQLTRPGLVSTLCRNSVSVMLQKETSTQFSGGCPWLGRLLSITARALGLLRPVVWEGWGMELV